MKISKPIIYFKTNIVCMDNTQPLDLNDFEDIWGHFGHLHYVSGHTQSVLTCHHGGLTPSQGHQGQISFLLNCNVLVFCLCMGFSITTKAC